LCLSHALLFHQAVQLRRVGERPKATRHVPFADEPGNLCQHRQVEVRHLDRWRRDQEKSVDRLAIHRVVCNTVHMPPEGQPYPIENRRAAVGNGDALTHAGRSLGFALEHQIGDRLAAFRRQAEERHHLPEDFPLGPAVEVEVDGCGRNEVPQAHAVEATVPAGACQTRFLDPSR